MLARLLLVALSILALAWIGVLLRDQEVGKATLDRLVTQRDLAPAGYAREMQRFEAAELLNPDSTWRLYEGIYSVNVSRSRAAEVLEELLQDEPDNVEGWTALMLITNDFDENRSAEARAAIRRLDPLGEHR